MLMCIKATHPLPDKDVVNHRTATKDDAQSDEDARDDGRRRVELDKRVQDDSCRQNYKSSFMKILICDKNWLFDMSNNNNSIFRL